MTASPRARLPLKQKVRRRLRSFLTRFPGIHPTKYAVSNYATRHLGFPANAEFRLLRHFPKLDLALDIGSNWGQSIEALRHYAPSAQIVGFEPIPSLAKRLQRLYDHDRRVTIHHCALGNDRGQIEICVPRYRGTQLDGLAALDPRDIHDWLENPDLFYPYDPRCLEIETFAVEIKRLDDFQLRPQLVKMDVQGAEMLVSLGGERTLREAAPITIVEAPSRELIDLMISFGMRPYSTDGNRAWAYDAPTENVIFLSDHWVSKLAVGLCTN